MRFCDIESRIKRAGAAGNETAVREAVGELLAAIGSDGEALGEAVAAELLEALFEAKAYSDVLSTAEACLQQGHRWPVLFRASAQTLIEQGWPCIAIDMLETLQKRLSDGTLDRAYCDGHLGRAHKELSRKLSTAPDRYGESKQELRRSTLHYHALWQVSRDKRSENGWFRGWRWSATNLLDQLLEMEAEGIARDNLPEPRELAQELITGLSTGSDLSPYDLATLGNACLYLGFGPAAGGGQVELIERGAQHYTAMIRHGEVSRRQLASTLANFAKRQHRREYAKHPSVAAMLLEMKAKLARAERRITVFTEEDITRLQAIADDVDGVTQPRLGEGNLQDVAWLAAGVVAAGCVVGIHELGQDKPYASGFLIDGALVASKFAGRRLILTCCHCVSTTRFDVSLPVDRIEVRSSRPDALGKTLSRTFTVNDVVFESDVVLDAILLDAGTDFAGLVACAPAELAARGTTEDGRPGAFVIGHPNRWNLRMTLGGAQVTAKTDEYGASVRSTIFRYTSETKEGNSGGPVFNEAWGVFAMHVGILGDGYAKGIALGRVIDAAKERHARLDRNRR